VDTASDFYLAYVRQNVWIVIIGGIFLVSFFNRDRWTTYLSALNDMTWAAYFDVTDPRARRLMWAQLGIMWPVLIWLVAVMIPFIAIDVVLGPKQPTTPFQ